MSDLLIRFFVGGIVVSAFAVLGDLIRPRTYAGLYGAAPSVALATLALTVGQKGRGYAALEAETMILGAAAFLCYAGLASLLLRRKKCSALCTAIVLLPVWFGVSLGLYAVWAGRIGS